MPILKYFLVDKKAALGLGIYKDGDNHRVSSKMVLIRESEMDGYDTSALKAVEIAQTDALNLINSGELQ